MSSDPLYSALDFNIDLYLNPYIPKNHTSAFPQPIAHFLGHRTTTPKEPPSTIQWALTLVSTIAGLVVVGAVYNYAPALQSWKPPPMIASLGAAAILEFNAIRSPFGQPRNAILGHTLAAIVAVGVAKLFMLAPGFYGQYMWVASCVSCAAASVLMSMTNTVHPPGGATAVLACTEAEIIALGWRFPALILLGSVLLVLVAMMFNNTCRWFPIFWWTSETTGQKLHRNHKAESDEEAAENDETMKANGQPNGILKNRTGADSDRTLAPTETHEVDRMAGSDTIFISPNMVRLPDKLDLSEAESEALLGLMIRLRSYRYGQ